jgi:hypothetical protein
LPCDKLKLGAGRGKRRRNDRIKWKVAGKGSKSLRIELITRKKGEKHLKRAGKWLNLDKTQRILIKSEEITTQPKNILNEDLSRNQNIEQYP